MSRQHLYNAPSTTSEQIRQEIQRFESVHPCIYAIYDILESIPDPLIAQQIRENVVCIEDSFVNSQEWTLSRCVPDLKLGVVGSLLSGKSALVHRYLTGAYMQEESPEGGRFKKEVVIDGQPYILLIRDEGGPPEQQFAHWVDAVLFVFSLENEESFNAVYNFYAKLAHYRNTAEIPMILVGTQDAISESNPRVIDDIRARKLANDLKRCAYFETCATYGLNVERVFRDACVKIIQQRNTTMATPTSVLHQQQQQHNHVVAPSPSSLSQANASVGGSGGGGLPTTSCPSTPSHQWANGNQARFNYFAPLASTNVSASTGGGSSSALSSQQHAAAHHHHHRSQAAPEQNFVSGGPAGPPGGGGGVIQASSHSSFHGHHHHHHHHHNQQQQHHYQHNNNTDNISVGGTTTPSSFAPSPLRKQASGSTSSNSPTFQLAASGVSPAPSNHSVCSLQQCQSYQYSPATEEDCKQTLSICGGSFGGSVRERGGGAGIVNLTFNDSSTVVDGSQLVTPSSTPTTQRKNRRISNIFNRKDDDKMKNGGGGGGGGLDQIGIGVGRAIPVKQGQLYKRSSKTLNKEWKKKYVCLYNDGRLSYYPNIKDYMDEVHGKEVFLGHTTVKVPGQRPRGSQQQRAQTIATNGLMTGGAKVNKSERDRVQLTSFESIREGRHLTTENNSFLASTGTSDESGKFETPNMKKKEKKHMRRPGGGLKNSENDDGDSYDFIIVSIDNRQWHFEASSAEDRDEWVQSIEQQIFASLQGNESNKRLSNSRSCSDRSKIQALRNIPGNAQCADCSAADPDWVSLNLGALICIECSGIHRNLGTHISKVRSLNLDELPSEYMSVMQSLGNNCVNSIWEYDTNGKQKPGPTSPRESKESWIRSKYEKKSFLMPLSIAATTSSPVNSSPSSSLTSQLAEAMFKKDLRLVVFLLAHCTVSQINSAVGSRDLRTPLHLSAAAGSPTVTQLLIWYNADVNAVDQDKRTALWYAKNSGSQDCVDILIRNGCTSDFIPSPSPSSATITVVGPNASSTPCSTNSSSLVSSSSLSSKFSQTNIVNRQLSVQQQQPADIDSCNSDSTLTRRKQQQQTGTAGLPNGNGSASGASTARGNYGNAFDKLPASII